MAFDSLSDKLQNIFKNLRGKGRLSEADVKAALKEVKMALLEADVNFKVVKQFVKSVEERAIGQDVMQSLTPGQMVIKIVNEEMVALMGSETTQIALKPGNEITVIMMAGLQGAGKTTTTAKLAGKFKAKGKKPLLAACDVYRPAAIKQLQVVGSTYNIPVFEMGQGDPVEISKEGIKYATGHGHDVVIIDTAGRLHIDENLMDELLNIKNEVKPQEILLVIDAMTGQDAVNVAETFNSKLGVDGVIITKMDGDTRGGAALSVRAVTGKPIKYVGMGEKMEDLEPFYPDRMASRILGMGDVLSLIEKAQGAFDEKQAKELEKKMRTQEFNLEDFMNQLQQIKKMGPIKDLMKMIPGIGGKINLDEIDVDDNATKHIEAIIQSMTPAERQNPDILNGSRKKRIAKGCGRSIQEVNKLLKQFNDMKKMMKSITDMQKGRKGRFKMPFGL